MQVRLDMAIAARLALGIEDPLAQALEHTIINASEQVPKKDTNASRLLKQFDDLHHSGGDDPLLPFQLSLVDKAIAKLHYRHYLTNLDYDALKKPGLKIHSDWSSSYAGYADLHCSGVKYQPRHLKYDEYSGYRIVLKPFFKEEMVTRLSGLPSAPQVNARETDDGIMISLELDSAVARYRPTNDERAEIFLIDPEAPMANSSTSIRGVEVRLSSQQVRITITEPEAIMQVTAAHFRGFWLVICSGEFQTAFPIPDLSGSGESKPAIFALSNRLLSPYFKQTKPVALKIASATAIELSQRFWWFATDNLAEMVVETMKATRGIRST